MSVASTIRNAAIMTTTAVALLAASSSGAAAQQQTAQAAIPPTNAAVTVPTNPAGMTTDQCKVFKGILTDYIKLNGRENLSDAFVNAMVDFAINKKCSGPANIPVDGKEIDIFNSISRVMYSTQGVQLNRMGVVMVRRTASLQGPTN